MTNKTFTVAMAGQKGGAGKSTLAIALASELHKRGLRTLLVDADQQGSSATWGQVAAEQGASAPDVIMMGANLHVQLPSVSRGYDVVIIDCPGRSDAQQRGALAVADMALIPVTPDTTDMWALDGTLRIVREACVFRPQLQPWLVLNKMRAGTSEAASARELFEAAGIPLMQATMGLRITYGRFTSAGVGVTSFEPGGKASEEVLAWVDEVHALIAEATAQPREASYA
jgi:chromosome partitioning protein